MSHKFLLSFPFHLPADLARFMADQGLEYSCYARQDSADWRFDHMVDTTVEQLFKDPGARDVMEIHQTHPSMCATHVIKLFEAPGVGGRHVGTIFFRYNNLDKHPANVPPFFTILHVGVDESVRRKGYGALLVKLAKQLALSIVDTTPKIREEVASTGKYSFHIVAFVPNTNVEYPENFPMHDGFFRSLSFFPMDFSGYAFGACEEYDFAYTLKVGISKALESEDLLSSGSVSVAVHITPPPADRSITPLLKGKKKRTLVDVDGFD